MKKILALFIVLFLPCIASAEEDTLQVDGEWYAVVMHTNMSCRSADLKVDGCYYVSWSNGEDIVFRERGEIEFIHTEEWVDFHTKETQREVETETIVSEYCRLSDDAVLYYDVMDDELTGYYICKSDNEWIAYLLDSASMVLFLNGKVIPYNGDASADYLVSGDKMFMTQGDKYVRGMIRQQGQNAFIYDIDADPWIVTYGEVEVDYGKPFYLFVSTSIGK